MKANSNGVGGMLKNGRCKRLKANRFRIASMQLLKSHLKWYPRATLKNKQTKPQKQRMDHFFFIFRSMPGVCMYVEKRLPSLGNFGCLHSLQHRPLPLKHTTTSWATVFKTNKQFWSGPWTKKG